MAERPADRLFGTDLAVVQGFAAHDASPLDLALDERVARRGAAGAGPTDLARMTRRDNLAQALILRLLTARGSLAALGHAGYGSRLHELVGQAKTDAARHRCRAFVLEAVAQEPRVEPRAVAFAYDVDAETASSLRFTVTVRPRSGDGDLPLTLEVGL
jgi:phage baseplate assembly protein W